MTEESMTIEVAVVEGSTVEVIAVPVIMTGISRAHHKVTTRLP